MTSQHKNEIYIIEGSQEELEMLHKALCRLVAVHSSTEERVQSDHLNLVVRKIHKK